VREIDVQLLSESDRKERLRRRRERERSSDGSIRTTTVAEQEQTLSRRRERERLRRQNETPEESWISKVHLNINLAHPVLKSKCACEGFSKLTPSLKVKELLICF